MRHGDDDFWDILMIAATQTDHYAAPPAAPELVPNGDFNSAVGHTFSDEEDVFISAGKLTLNGGGSFDTVTANETLVPGTYRSTVEVTQVPSGTLVQVSIGGGAYTNIPGTDAVGTFSVDVVAGSITNQTLRLRNGAEPHTLESWSVTQIA